MTAEQFAALAERLDSAAQKNPRAYKYRVFLLATLGYLYWLLPLEVGLLFCLFQPVGVWLLALAVGVLLLLVWWIRVRAPEGVPIESHDAPRLFRAIEQIRERLKFPMFHRVLLVNEFNAGVLQVPRLGALGWDRNYLLLGLPLLMGVSQEQFQAVLAHEFYHLFGAHSRLDHWFHRIRWAWNRKLQVLEARPRWWNFPTRKLLQWYVPMLNAHTFVQMRRHEYEADRFAADLVGTRPTADLVVALKLKAAYLGEAFWPELWKGAQIQAEAPENPFAEMEWALRRALPAGTGEPWLRRALAEKTEGTDSHPALADRLAALGEAPRLPEELSKTAAEHYLGAALDPLAARLTREWRKKAEGNWRRRHEHSQHAQKTLAALGAKAREQPLTQDETWKRASLTEDLRGSEAALSLYRECQARFPQHAGTNYALGRILLAKNSDEGIPLVEKAIALDADYMLAGCELLYSHLMANGRTEQAQACAARYRRRHMLLEDMQAQRSILLPTDRYFSHDFSEEEVARLQEQLARYPQIARVYLVRKHVKLLPDKPHYVLAFVWRFWQPIWNEAKLIRQLAQEVAIPRGTTTFVSVHYSSVLRRRMKNVPGSRIYRRPWFAKRRKRARAKP